MHLACLALIERGDEILMPDPSYPCNRHFVSAAEGRAVLIAHHGSRALPAQQRQGASRAGADKTRGVLLASPSNPTGTSIAPAELRRIHERGASRKGGVTIVDEIYLGLSYEEAFGHSALAIERATSSASTASANTST